MMFWLNILRSPAVIAVAAILAVWGWGQVRYMQGKAAGVAELRLELERARHAAERRAAEALAQAEEQRAQDAQRMRELQDVVRELGDGCQLPDGVLERLRRLD